MIDFKICDFTVDYITQAQELLRQGYERERAHIPFMPPFSETAEKLKAPCFCLHNEAQFAEYITDRPRILGKIFYTLYNQSCAQSGCWGKISLYRETLQRN